MKNWMKAAIGLIQMESELGDVPANLRKAVSLIGRAAEKGAQIICLPELFATGYNQGILQERNTLLGSGFYQEIVRTMSQAAKENHVYLIAPFARQGNLKGVLWNSASLFDEDGELLGAYDKFQLCGLEKCNFRSGSEIHVFNTRFGKIGVMICYDAGFPEICRSLCLKGAQIVFVPAAWRKQDSYMWDLNLSQRALENTLFVAGVNRVGMEGKIHLFGKSKICRPNGKILKELEEDREDILVETIDLQDVLKARAEIPYLRDRKQTCFYDLECSEEKE